MTVSRMGNPLLDLTLKQGSAYYSAVGIVIRIQNTQEKKFAHLSRLVLPFALVFFDLALNPRAVRASAVKAR